jgi:two-component system nitrogen regulation response regulator GlnG
MPVIWVAADTQHDPSRFPAEYTHVLGPDFGATELRSQIGKLLPAMSSAQDQGPDQSDLVAASPAMRMLLEHVDTFADCDSNVMLYGETGAGKERIARLLHDKNSVYGRGPFVAVNCGAIPDGLFESQFFGHAKGAFTGASGPRAGYFEDASDGTLFLDEIGELPLDLQPKLLRVLENGEFQRIGETQARRSSARIVTATNRDLKKEVREGRFRADLYHRLSVFTISIPPLRDLGDDRILLLEHFRSIYATQANLQPFRLAAATSKRLLAYPFPGNVRELRNIAIRLTTKYAGREIGVDELEAELDVGSDPLTSSIGATQTPAGRAELMAIALNDLQTRHDFNLDATLRLWEEAYIEAAQHLAHNNMSQAARLLGVNRTTLYNRIDALTREKRPGPNRSLF